MRRTMHPRNKYAENRPDFNLLASLYPSFKPYVSVTSTGSARIDWTDYSATRELTRVLLEHDYGIQWWIPDGQLCPTVPNRVNYIHWIEDLLSFCSSPWHEENQKVSGLDIGTGANCIYPLLGASLNGWSFVGTDITSVALDWALRNVQANPHLTQLVNIRKACLYGSEIPGEGKCTSQDMNRKTDPNPINMDKVSDMSAIYTGSVSSLALAQKHDSGNFEKLDLACKGDLMTAKDIAVCTQSPAFPLEQFPILVGVVKEGERFDFCMCNPPFFKKIEEAGANPRTACGGTEEEMVCPGGEVGFITRLIEDSFKLKNKIHWYTTMVGEKAVLKTMVAKLRGLHVGILRTTEFVQGRTSRWGLAWSFDTPVKRPSFLDTGPGSSHVSFLLEGLRGKCIPTEVLKALTLHLEACGTSCKVDIASYTIKGSLLCSPKDVKSTSLKRSRATFSNTDKNHCSNLGPETLEENTCTVSFQIVVFQQAPGAVLIKASLLKAENPAGNSLEGYDISSVFGLLLGHVKDKMKDQFSSNTKLNMLPCL